MSDMSGNSGEKRMLVLLGLVVALVGGYYLLYKPMKNGDESVSDEEVLTQELTIARKNITNLPVIQKEGEILEKDAKNSGFYFFNNTEEMNSHIEDMVKEHSMEMKLNLSKPKTSRKNKGSYAYTISGRGNYFAVLSLLDRIETSWPHLYITEFAISRRRPSNRVDPAIFIDNPNGGIKMPDPDLNVRVVFEAKLQETPKKKKRGRR